MGGDNDFNVQAMITRLMWTIWTSLSAVRERPLNLITHSLSKKVNPHLLATTYCAVKSAGPLHVDLCLDDIGWWYMLKETYSWKEHFRCLHFLCEKWIMRKWFGSVCFDAVERNSWKNQVELLEVYIKHWEVYCVSILLGYVVWCCKHITISIIFRTCHK